MSGSLDAVRELLDIEAVKQLKARYCAYCDDGYNPEGIASLFTQDGSWDGGDFGLHQGRDAIKSFFRSVSSVVTFAVHHVCNPIIEIDGESGRGDWLLWQALIMQPNDQPFWLSASYADAYRKVDGKWLFEKVTLRTKFFTPYAEGFGKTRLAPSALTST